MFSIPLLEEKEPLFEIYSFNLSIFHYFVYAKAYGVWQFDDVLKYYLLGPK